MIQVELNKELKPLVKAKEMIEDVELEVTYEYDDLVFVKHNAFLLRFDQEVAEKIYLHFNVDCEKEASEQLHKALELSAASKGLYLTLDNKYNMIADEKNNDLKIVFEG